jgi:cytochrome P450
MAFRTRCSSVPEPARSAASPASRTSSAIPSRTFWAAHDTSTITISTMKQYLGQQPQWQDRCRAESLALGTTDPSYADLDGLDSLDLVMKECLRIVSPVPVMARRVVQDTQVQGHFVPAGTYVAVVPHFTHHMSQYRPEPERFDPNASRRIDAKTRCTAMPGNRSAVGAQMPRHALRRRRDQAIMHHLLLRFDWHVDPDYVAPLDFKSLPFPSDGQPVGLRARTTTS